MYQSVKKNVRPDQYILYATRVMQSACRVSLARNRSEVLMFHLVREVGKFFRCY